jgi:acetyl esterase/lipase
MNILRNQLVLMALLVIVTNKNYMVSQEQTRPDTSIIDTSYTVHSAYKKYVKNYPFISIASYTPQSAVNMQRNRVYRMYGKRAMLLDLFEPATKSKEYRPCVILVHGGGWSSGNKSLLEPYALALADKGYVTACIEYRLSGEARYPAAVEDVRQSVKWIIAHAKEFSIDKNRISLLGASAGGQLATLVGATHKLQLFENPLKRGSNKIKIHSMINLDGVLAFLHPLSEEGGKPGKTGAAEKWFGTHFSQDSANWIEASPLTYAGPDTPPVLFIASSFPRFQAGRDDMIGIMDKHGIYSEKHVFEDAPHSFWLFNPWFEKTLNLILDFLGRED